MACEVARAALPGLQSAAMTRRKEAPAWAKAGDPRARPVPVREGVLMLVRVLPDRRAAEQAEQAEQTAKQAKWQQPVQAAR
jgi:hypothetical protein